MRGKREIQHMTEDHFIALHHLFLKQNDKRSATQIADLYDKEIHEKLYISFTGHFSAGKSSMINALLEEDILPKSPIPTSGNIVEITSDGSEGKVYFQNGDVKVYTQPYDLNQIKAYCKDNTTVKKVMLNTTKRLLPEGAILVDTPGIDAANDIDRVITESSLHLIDQIFYVMDYNHVQSGINFHFLKQLNHQQIPFYIIINQVDKHKEQELSFHLYEQHIKETFNEWGVRPESIYYTSLKNANHPHNMFHDVKNKLFELCKDKANLPRTTKKNIQKIISVHKRHLQENMEKSMIHPAVDTDANVSLKKLEDKLEQIFRVPEEMEHIILHSMNVTLKNAYVMPASLRVYAEAFLEAQEKGFKVGLLGLKNKTTKERERRTNIFLSHLQKSISSTITWRVRDKFITLLADFEYSNPHMIELTKQCEITVTEEDIKSLINKGAKVTGAYLLHYTNELSERIKQECRTKAMKVWTKIKMKIVQQDGTEVNELKQQMDHIKRINEERQHDQLKREELELEFAKIDEQLKQPNYPAKAKTALRTFINQENTRNRTNKKQLTDPVKSINKKPTETIKNKPKWTVKQTIKAIDRTIMEMKDVDGFHSFIEDLEKQRSQLQNRSVTIALFGAFSAGKSSFANALIGSELLPSSPNPTTSVINKITPVTTEYPHGTVLVTWKKEQVLVNEVREITKAWNPEDTSLPYLLDWIKKEKIIYHPELSQLYKSYLQALIIGYEDYSMKQADCLTLDIHSFSPYIIEEKKACFIKEVIIYYNCKLTNQGITLVDTPGADSIHARHTNTAFNYIKHADSIFFITYYNHALTSSDKVFLKQLGQVKESFQLDKMFFIINAIDLAESNEDCLLVQNYVEKQLSQLGIHSPQIFPISSKEALEEKQNNLQLNRNINLFEKSLHQFVNEDLFTLIIDSALWNIYRLKKTLNQYLKMIDLDKKEQREFQQTMLHKKNQLEIVVKEVDEQIYEERMKERIDRQFHYVLDRFNIQFSDLFKEQFNPATITSSGKRAQRELKIALQNLMEQINQSLLQQTQAIALRIEGFIQELLQEMHASIQSACLTIDEDCLLTKKMNEKEKMKSPNFLTAVEDSTYESLYKELNTFKNTKTFFAKNGRSKMIEDVYLEIKPFIKDYIFIQKAEIEELYAREWTILVTSLKRNIIKDIHHSYCRYRNLEYNSNIHETLQLKIDNICKVLSTGKGKD